MHPTIQAVLVRVKGSKLIIVNRSLHRIQKCHSIYHELYHHYSRIPHRSSFHRNEVEAEMFAAGMMLSHHASSVIRCNLNHTKIECGYLAMIIKSLHC